MTTGGVKYGIVDSILRLKMESTMPYFKICFHKTVLKALFSVISKLIGTCRIEILLALFANCEYSSAMNLKPQDIYILLKLIALDAGQWTYASLAEDLFMSTSEVHAGIKRAVSAHLMDTDRGFPLIKSLEEFLIHGIKYAFSPEKGALTRGIPTGYAAPPLKNMIIQTNEPPPVWPDPEGDTRGYEFSPLYKSVTKAARKDKMLYELLAIVDAIRDGRAREREIAIKELKIRLRSS